MTKKITNPEGALAAIQQRAMKEDGMPAFLARKPGDAPANRPMTAPKVPVSTKPIEKLLGDFLNAPKRKAAKEKTAALSGLAKLLPPLGKAATAKAIKAGKAKSGAELIGGLAKVVDQAFKAGKDGTPSLVDQAVTSLTESARTQVVNGKAAKFTKLPPAVAAGAYTNGKEAEAKTGITKKREAAGVKTPKGKPAPAAPAEGEARGKGGILISLLLRKEGATKEELRKATGWTIKSIASSIPSGHRHRYDTKVGTRGEEPCYFLTPKKHRKS